MLISILLFPVTELVEVAGRVASTGSATPMKSPDSVLAQNLDDRLPDGLGPKGVAII